MSLELLRDVLFWCTIINFSFLWLWLLFFMFAHDWMYGLHTRWFKVSVERFDAIHYAGMAMYKMAFIIFNAVPLIALYIVG